MSGFTNQGLFSITKEPFGDWAKAAEKAAATAPTSVNRNIGRVFSAVEDHLRDAIVEHPAWPSEISDRTSFRPTAGGYELQVEDERVAGLEFGHDPARSPAMLLRPMADQMADRIGDSLRGAVRRGAGL